MKTHSLVALTVASTFGWSAASLAATGHPVHTPYSPNETGEFQVQDGSIAKPIDAMLGATAAEAGGGFVAGSYDPSMRGVTVGGDRLAKTDDRVPDVFLVTWTSETFDGQEYFLIDEGPERIVMIEAVDLLVPTHELALAPIQGEDTYEITLIPLTYGIAEAVSFESMEEGAGE